MRTVIVHYHIFKNAGSTFDSMLEAAKTRGNATTLFTWHCADRSKVSRKLGYFTYYPPLKWVIATAVNASIAAACANEPASSARSPAIPSSMSSVVCVADLWSEHTKTSASKPESRSSIIPAGR